MTTQPPRRGKAAPALPSAPSAEILTLEEVDERYNGNWVVLRITEFGQHQSPQAGQVMMSGDHDAVWAEAARLAANRVPGTMFYIFWAGPNIRSYAGLKRSVAEAQEKNEDIDLSWLA